MRRRQFLFVLFIAGSFGFYAQIKINWGPFVKNPQGVSNHNYIIAQDSEKVYSLIQYYGFKGHEFWYLEAVNKTTKRVVFSTPLPSSPSGERNLDWDNVAFIGSNLYLFCISRDEKAHTISCMASLINNENGTRQAQIKIFSDTVLFNFSSVRLFYSSSPDGNSMLIGCRVVHPIKNKFSIINQNAQVVYDIHLHENTLSNSPYLVEAKLNNKGSIIAYLYQEDPPSYSLVKNELCMYSSDNERWRSFPISFPQPYFLYDFKFLQFTNGEVMFTSLLSTIVVNEITNKEEIKPYSSGLYTVRADFEKQEFISSSAQIFPKNEQEELYGIGRGWTNGQTSYFKGLYFITDAIERTDGSITLLTEIRSSHWAFFPANPLFLRGPYPGTYVINPKFGYYGNPKPVREFESSLISVFNIAPDGKLNWLKMIPKYQKHVKKSYLSFAYGNDDDKIFLVYNDHRNNLKRDMLLTPTCMENPRKARVVLVSIDNFGNISKRPLFLAKDNKRLALKPMASDNLTKNSIFFLTEKRNHFRFAELRVD